VCGFGWLGKRWDGRNQVTLAVDLGTSLTPASTAGPKVRVDDVTHFFASPRKGAPPAIVDVSLDIADGEFAAVVGPSGCGKSTLLNLISGLLTPTHGRLYVSGEPVVAVRHDVGYMPARDALLPWRTVVKNVEFPLEIQRRFSANDRNDRARELLEAVGLHGFESYYPHALSQGMRQRVAIARTFATEPEVLLMDEPFSALDAQTKLQIQDLFLSMWERQHHTVLLITHDVVEAVALADKVVVFSEAPGTVRSEYYVNLSRPRSVQHLLFEEPVFQDHLRKIWADLKPRSEAAP
jgi:NitT/TauT family transport system ATP-binding protein